MIEDYTAKRRRARLVARALLLGGLALAVVSALVTYAIASRVPPPDAASETVAVLVAARDLPARVAITAADVRVARAVAESVPAGALAEPGAAIGRITTQAIARNEIVVPARFSETGGSAPFAIYPAGQAPGGSTPDWRAMSLAILDAQAVGGAVQPGDTVDVLFSLTYIPASIGVSAATDADYAGRILAERVTVLARKDNIYTLRVDAAQAERMAAMLAASASVQLLLRSGDDTRAPRASGAIYSSEAGALLRAIPTVRPPGR